MTPQEKLQLKMLCLQVSSGNLVNAQSIFDWVVEDTIAAEVATRMAALVAQMNQDSVTSA